MAENLTQNQIITIAGRKKMLRARAGEIQLPKIVGFVFGDGGVDADGNRTAGGRIRTEERIAQKEIRYLHHVERYEVQV